MEKLEKLLNLSKDKSEACELFYMKSFGDKLKFEANELQSMRAVQSEGAALRIRKNGKMGFATSTEQDETIIEKALESSEFGNKTEFDFAKEKLDFSPKDYIDEKIDKIQIEEFIERGESIIKNIRDFDSRINVNVLFEKISEETHLLTSSGFNENYRKNKLWMFIKTELTRENDIFETWNFKAGIPDEEKEAELIKETIWKIKNGMDIVKIDSGKYPVLFHPEALYELMTSFISGVNGNKVFRKTSPLYSKLGEKIFDERFTIYDDGTCKGAINAIPFDDEGILSQKTLLVEKGVLRNFLVDLKNGKKLNMTPTGNASRSLWIGERDSKSYPGISPTTITMDSGNIPKADMIKGIKTGILLKSAPDFSMGNIQNGDFSGTVYLGYKIENGTVKGRVKNTVITGNLYNLFKDRLLEISRERAYSTSFESILPYVMFKDVEVTSG